MTRPLSQLWCRLVDIPLSTLIGGVSGLLVGLLVGALLSIPLAALPGWPGSVLPLVVTLTTAALGVGVGLSRVGEFRSLLPQARSTPAASASAPPSPLVGQPILLDTSAIIDGRISDISRTGFLNGTLIIPRFILDELHHIADATDSLRRNRGRRGLEVLNTLRKDTEVPLQVLDVDMRANMEVDSKLVRLARNMSAPIVTTDYNLNRVAELQGVKVLNVNELANSLKPVVLPGEEMPLHIIQEGKEPGQGVGFLDDGTMVVVEGGKRYINTHLDVSVTRVLQTAAGRIIFAQPKDASRNAR